MAGNTPPYDDDPARTVIVPNPGGRRARPSPSSSAAPVPDPHTTASGPFDRPPAAATAPSEAFGVPQSAVTAPQQADAGPSAAALTGMNTLNANAATLFSLVSRVRSRSQSMDVERLHASAVAEIRNFEARSIKAGIEPQQVRVARYAICATLDDVVLNTPVGSNSNWAQRSLVGTFEKETVSGDRFYQMLQRLQQNPGQNLDLLEFVYMCLTLGFEGRLRVEQGGPDKHLALRKSLATTIRNNRGDVEHALSPHWSGTQVPFKQRSLWLPVWIALGSVAAVLGVIFFALSALLWSDTDRLMGSMLAINDGPAPALERRAPPPPPPPPPPPEVEAPIQRLSAFLQPEIAAKLLTVFEDANTVTVRLNGAGMFAPASDALQQEFREPLERVAKALNGETGRVIIAGHSDNVPINTARFPSNLHLSLARAKSVMEEMAGWMEDPARISAEGRSDREPIASNETQEGRAENRRIEVILVKGSGQ